MHRKLTLILLVLAASLTVGAGGARRHGAAAGRPWRHPEVDPPRRHGAAHRASASAYASVSRGAEAYFKYVNARGGVNGRTITYRFLDDGYNPAETVPLTRQLVEQDKVFAIFNSLGTESNLAVRPYLNAVEGAAALRRLRCDHVRPRLRRSTPYTIGFQPSYQAEGWVYGQVPRAHGARSRRSRSCSRTTTTARTCSAG